MQRKNGQINRNTLKKILKAQKKLYLKPDDKVLVFITADYDADHIIADVLRDHEHKIVSMLPIKRPSEDYKLPKEVLEGKTVGWLITNISISHSPMTKQMMEQGMFIISNPGITPDWLEILKPANRSACRERSALILSTMGGDVGGTFHITANDGTNLKLKVPFRNWQEEIGTRMGVGTNGVYGELATAPYWAEGKYVLEPGDFLTNPINRINERIILTICDNRVVDIKGGNQAEMLKRILKETYDNRAYNLGEFAIGLCPIEPKKIHCSVVAEKLLGGIHIALGSNATCLKEDCPEINKFQYGRYAAGVHIDCIKFDPSVFFEPEHRIKTIMKNGCMIT